MYFFILFIFTLFPKTDKLDKNLLIGLWHSEGENLTETIIYNKTDKQIIGQNLEFNLNGSFLDRNIQPCGSDSRIHHYEGKWRIDKNNVIQVFDLIEVYNKAHYYLEKKDILLQKTGQFQIVRINKTELIIKKTIDYELLVDKN